MTACTTRCASSVSAISSWAATRSTRSWCAINDVSPLRGGGTAAPAHPGTALPCRCSALTASQRQLTQVFRQALPDFLHRAAGRRLVEDLEYHPRDVRSLRLVGVRALFDPGDELVPVAPVPLFFPGLGRDAQNVLADLPRQLGSEVLGKVSGDPLRQRLQSGPGRGFR